MELCRLPEAKGGRVMLRSLFFKTVLVSFLTFFGFSSTVFSCDGYGQRFTTPGRNVRENRETENKNLDNIDLRKELEKEQETLNRMSQQSKEIHDAAQEAITTTRD